MTARIRNIVRRIVLWACPGLRADTTGMRADIDIAHRAAAIARLETSQVRTSLAEWQRHSSKLTELVMTLLREVDAVKESAASKPAGFDARLAKIEMLMMPPVSDGVLELTEAQERAIERALDNAGKAVVS